MGIISNMTLIGAFVLSQDGIGRDRRPGMDEQRFNMSMRKYLKEVGVTSQQAIERVVREESLAGKSKLKMKMVLTAEGTNLKHVVEGSIDLG
jgi:histidinol phosphatase-like enzyme